MDKTSGTWVTVISSVVILVALMGFVISVAMNDLLFALNFIAVLLHAMLLLLVGGKSDGNAP